MMPYQGSQPRVESLGFTMGTTSPVTVTSGGTAHTKGAWTTISASLPFETEGLWVRGTNPNVFPTEQGNTLLDLGIGAAPDEIAVIPNLWHPFSYGFQHYLPLRLRKGIRLSARIQAQIASSAVQLAVYAVGAGNWTASGLERCESCADLAGTEGILLTDPGAANTKAAAWTTLIAACAFDVKKMLVTNFVPYHETANARSMMDIGIGASPLVIIPDIYSWSKSFSGIGRTSQSFWDMNIPAGSKISARHQSTGDSSAVRTCYAQVVLFG
jgi:hypothetical protein